MKRSDMHKAPHLSFVARHRVFIISSCIWLVIWGAISYVFYRFPYALDIFDLNASGASLTENSIIAILIAIACGTFTSLLDAFVRDRKRVQYLTRPVPSLNEKLFQPHN